MPDQEHFYKFKYKQGKAEAKGGTCIGAPGFCGCCCWFYTKVHAGKAEDFGPKSEAFQQCFQGVDAVGKLDRVILVNIVSGSQMRPLQGASSFSQQIRGLAGQ